MSTDKAKELSPAQRAELMNVLKDRFEQNMNRHKGLQWAKVEARLEAKPDSIATYRHLAILI